MGDADNLLADVTDEAGLEVASLTSTANKGASVGACVALRDCSCEFWVLLNIANGN